MPPFDPEQNFSEDIFDRVLSLARKTVIVATTWNRKNTVDVCLRQTAIYRLGSPLWVYDDGSDEYSEEFLLDIADRVYRQAHGEGGREGVKKLRSLIMNSILQEGYAPHDEWIPEDFPEGLEYIYHIDSDVIHDPWFFHRIYELSQKFPEFGAICLYNPKFHPSSKKCRINPRTFPDIHTVVRTAGYGCSMFFPLRKFKENLGHVDIPEGGVGWDLYYSQHIAQGNVIMSATSYVDHLGKGGIHNDISHQKTRAINPTLYLTEIRNNAIKAMKESSDYYD